MREKFKWEIEEANRLAVSIATETHKKGEAVFWNSNGAPVPADCFERAEVPMPSGQRAALDRYYAAVVGNYRQQQAKMTKEERAERDAEARAAHGPGVVLVDVFTGRKSGHKGEGDASQRRKMVVGFGLRSRRRLHAGDVF